MKTKILSILALLLMTVTQGAWAQETLTVFDENGTSEHIPMCGYFFDNYTKSECIIPASELTAMEGGTITAITFYAKTVAGSNPTFGTANQKVFLKEVSGTTLSSYSGMADATVVFDGLLPMPTTSASGYTITFSQGYTYNGGNLLIGVYNDAKDLYNKVEWYGNNNQSDRVSAYGYSTSSLASVSYEKQNFLPKTTFTYTPAPQGSWNYDYTGAVQSFTAPYEGTYTLEAWGAQGGNWVKTGRSPGVGGKGGYASGTVTLAKNQTIYIYVGGKGATTENQQSGGAGGWNGGGNGGNSVSSQGDFVGVGAGGGGGASHVSLSNTQVIGTDVNTLSGTNYLIVAGGGGGAVTWTATAGAGGGTEGGAGATTGGTSLSPWYNSTLSTGCNGYNAVDYSSFSAEGTGGGGGGYLGGNAGTVTSGTSNQDCGGCGGSSNYNSTYVSNFTTTSNVREGAGKVTITFLSGEGTEDSPYLIASTTDWNNLVSAVNGGETYSGNYFKMTANVGTVSTWMTGTFSGTFDGDGKTLTVGYSATTNNCAPFGYLNGTVQNLKVAGNISTSKQYAGGLAAWVKTGHTANVTNCRVAATINSTYSGDGSSAGFVAYVDGRLNVTGCAFTGTLAGSNAYAWGGFVSYNVGTSVITNCLFAPASVTAKADYSATVGRNGGGTLNFATNFYYTQKFNTAQGMQARTIVKGDGVSTLSVTKGSGTTYNVAGITVYSNGVDYNSTFYGGSGQTVSLALTHETPSGYWFKQYAVDKGTIASETTNTPTLTMPAANSTANDVVTISAEYDPLAGEGTEASPYLIASTTDWDNLSTAVNGGETYSGNYFKMTANIGTVTTMVGTSANPFNGTFDGNGHTLNVNISNSNADTRTAPFAWAGGSAVIKNLHVTGSLTNTARTSGIVGTCNATTQISSCRVSATISGGNHTSGISISGGQITNCLFDGKINGTGSTAGFATYVAEGTKITNCLFKPQSGSSIPSNQGCFYTSESGKTPTFDNCYYTSTAGGTAQGSDGSGMIATQLVENLGASNWKVVDGNAIPKVHPNLAGEGTEASPYLIASTTDWNDLVSAVNAGETYSGNYFKMTANVGTVSTWMTGTFSGTFDGYGNTLTVDYSATTENCAPFGTLSGATVKKLKVAGSISSNQKLVAGIAALCSSTGNNVTNCLVSATINSSYSGNAADGGLVAVVDNGASLNVTGCAFAGKLLTTNGTTSCGGIVGWRRPSGTVTITNCLYAPTSATGSETWIASAEGENGNANFCRWNSSEPTITNCYYTTDFGSGDYTAQGLQARSISAGDYVTVANDGAATVYNVSGITSYGTGIQYGGVLYGGNEDAVSLTLTAPAHDGYGFVYSADNGTVTGNGNPYTLTMVDANAIINVKYSASKAINKYTSDENGWYLIASPIGIVSPEDVTNMTANTYDIYRFNQNPTPTMVDEVSQYLEWENWKRPDEGEGGINHYHFNLEPGRGYLYANSSNVTLTFIGTPYEGDGIVPLVRSNSNGNNKANMLGWNLIGNPFGVTAFVDTESFYVMNDGGSDIAPADRIYVEPMEGIFVQANEDGDTLTFSTQAPSKGHIQKPESEQVVLNLSRDRGSVIDRAIVRMGEGQALPKFQIRENSTKLYIPQGTEEYAIVSVGNVGEMPVNFKAKENGNYTISVNPENVEMNYLHLIDNMTGADVDLLQTPSYTFNATTNDYESRFKLVFSTNTGDGASTGSGTFAFYSNGSWVIANEGEATLQVVDLMGRILSSETINGYVSKSINQPAGVYMIRLINGENVKVQKIVVK